MPGTQIPSLNSIYTSLLTIANCPRVMCLNLHLSAYVHEPLFSQQACSIGVKARTAGEDQTTVIDLQKTISTAATHVHHDTENDPGEEWYIPAVDELTQPTFLTTCLPSSGSARCRPLVRAPRGFPANMCQLIEGLLASNKDPDPVRSNGGLLSIRMFTSSAGIVQLVTPTCPRSSTTPGCDPPFNFPWAADS